MTSKTGNLQAGKKQIEEVARRYAGQHGLVPTSVSWDQIGDDLVLNFETESNRVQISFSPDEIDDFPGDGATFTKKKIRDKFASLSI